jgi:MBG domain (YGX type)
LASAFGNSGTIDTGIGNQTLILTGSGSVLSPNVSAATQALALGTLQFTNGTGLASNYAIAASGNAGTVTPATLTYVADTSTQFVGSTFAAFTGTVTGFVHNETLASATTGTPSFTTLATALSIPGSYAISGSGLTANFGNYVFAQAPGNTTALTLNPAPQNPPSQSVPSSTPSSSSQVGITFQNPSTTANVTRVSFTTSAPGTTTAGNQTGSNDVNTAALTAGDRYMHNGGRYFPPISQYDSEQYSDFKLPPYAPGDSQATVLTILARGIAQANAAKYMIDGFWNGEDNTWPGPGHIDLLDKATFSDGAGHVATPTNDPAFPIASGKTDFAALLNNGPVMIGGPSDPRPVQWLLATGMAPDGKGIICDDTMTGKLVELAYDPATKTVGGITKLYDDKSDRFVPLADASNNIPASDVSGLSGLQSFVPSTYFAVTVH